jgi:hypothetical protein
MHLRMPSIDQGVQAFLWALFFFLFLWFGMLSVGVGRGTSFILAAVAGVLIFLYVRVYGENELGPRDDAAPRRGISPK